VADLDEDGQIFIMAKGGKGGSGNFKVSFVLHNFFRKNNLILHNKDNRVKKRNMNSSLK